MPAPWEDINPAIDNDDWEVYQVYHRGCEQQRLYGAAAGKRCGSGTAETEALRSAA